MAASQLDEYLSRLDAALPLPRRQRDRIVAEVADGLHSAAEAMTVAGLTKPEAESAAIEEFGESTDLAAEFAQALAPGIARRVGLALVLSGPMVGLAWVAAFGHGIDWMTRITSVLVRMPYFPVVLAVTVPAAMVAVLGGSISLRRNTSSRLATLAARVAASGCVVADLLLEASAFARLESGLFAVGGWVTVAVLLSALRLAVASNATSRLARLRAAGY